VTDGRAGRRFQGGNFTANRDRFAPLRDVADDIGATTAQLALAWLLHQAPDIVPIPGTRTPAHLDENLGAAYLALDADTLARLEAIAAPGTAAGSALLWPQGAGRRRERLRATSAVQRGSARCCVSRRTHRACRSPIRERIRR
jgi:hypothetical protein